MKCCFVKTTKVCQWKNGPQNRKLFGQEGFVATLTRRTLASARQANGPSVLQKVNHFWTRVTPWRHHNKTITSNTFRRKKKKKSINDDIEFQYRSNVFLFFWMKSKLLLDWRSRKRSRAAGERRRRRRRIDQTNSNCFRRLFLFQSNTDGTRRELRWPSKM